MTKAEAAATVWSMAERKHQDECYWNPCTYCEALTITAMEFVEEYPGEEVPSRMEAYFEE